MYYWVVFLGDKGKFIHSGPYTTESRAQHYADENVHSRVVEVIESRSRVWSSARSEVVQKFSELHHNTELITERYSSTERPGRRVGERKPRFKKIGRGSLSRKRSSSRLRSEDPKDSKRVELVR